MFLNDLYRLAVRGYRLELALFTLAFGAAWAVIVIAVNVILRLL